MFLLSYDFERIALSNLASCTKYQCYAHVELCGIIVNMSIFSQPGLAPGLWFWGLCGLCMSNNYKLCQMIEEGLCIT